MKATFGTLVLAAALCGCSAPDDSAINDASIGAPPPGDQQRATDQPPPGAPPAGADLAIDSEIVVPERFRGDWAASVEACSQPGEPTQLHIGDDDIRFHESEGPIVSLVERGDRLTLLARLTGEGETRDASYTFAVSADGTLLTDANGFTRQRCN